MDLFRRLAVLTIARDASFVALAGATLMIGFSFHPALALLIGANIAFIFCLGLSFRALRLNAERITRTEPWRGLERNERPQGDAAREWACATFRDQLLRGAKVAALAAIVLSASSLIFRLAGPPGDQAWAVGERHALHATVR